MPRWIGGGDLILHHKNCNLYRRNGCFQHSTTPNLNGSQKDRAMASKTLPSPDVLRQLLRYEHDTGKLFWRWRDDISFPCNSRFAGKEAFTSLDRGGYGKGVICGRTHQTHRVVWAIFHGEWPEHEVDHINGVRSDNRITNLRNATASQNQWNKVLQKNNTSGVKGVSWHTSNKKWRASITKHGKLTHLGLFDDIADASAAYAAASIKMHGEFSCASHNGEFTGIQKLPPHNPKPAPLQPACTAMALPTPPR